MSCSSKAYIRICGEENSASFFSERFALWMFAPAQRWIKGKGRKKIKRIQVEFSVTGVLLFSVWAMPVGSCLSQRVVDCGIRIEQDLSRSWSTDAVARVWCSSYTASARDIELCTSFRPGTGQLAYSTKQVCTSRSICISELAWLDSPMIWSMYTMWAHIVYPTCGTSIGTYTANTLQRTKDKLV